MKANKSLALAVLSVVGAAALSACGMNVVDWKSKYASGEAALAKNPPQLAAAEEDFKAALMAAWKAGVPEPQFEPAFEALGETLMREGKYGESQDYLVHALGLATATNMSSDQSIKLYKELLTAYERTSNYDQAQQTANVMAKFIEAELSPASPHYAFAVAEEKRFKQLIKATCSAAGGDACCHEHKKENVQEKAKLAADQPAVAPAAD